MLRRRLMVFRLHFRGRAGAWLALVGQFCAIVGLPLPAASAGATITRATSGSALSDTHSSLMASIWSRMDSGADR